MDKLLTAKQAADTLGISISSVRRRIKSGSIKTYRIGGLIRIRPADLERYIEERPNETA